MILNELSRDILRIELRGMGISYEQFENYDVHLQKVITRKCMERHLARRKNDKEVLIKSEFNENSVGLALSENRTLGMKTLVRRIIHMKKR